MSSAAGGTAEVAPKTIIEKIKHFTKMYGAVFVATYIGVYVTTLGSIFLAIKSGNTTCVHSPPPGGCVRVRWALPATPVKKLTTRLASLTVGVVVDEDSYTVNQGDT